MKAAWLTSALATLVLSTALQAQQDSNPPTERGANGMMMRQQMQQQMRMMDSMNARLDTLVGRMNRASGNAKVTLMGQVINELVAQRKAMHERMRQMMRSRGRMMGTGEMMMMDMGADSAGPETATRKPAVDTVADTAGHGEHHPKQ